MDCKQMVSEVRETTRGHETTLLNEGGHYSSENKTSKNMSSDLIKQHNNIKLIGSDQVHRENTSYISSSSDSSSHSFEENTDKIEMEPPELFNDEEPQNHPYPEQEIVPKQFEMTESQKIKEMVVDTDRIEKSHINSHELQSPQVLSNRIKSLEAQLDTLQKLMTTLIQTSQRPMDKSMADTSDADTHIQGSHQRVSSMILLESIGDLDDNERHGDKGPETPQKISGRSVSPTPNLEYRSYTPNYEEELLRLRKTSRGMSLENLNKDERGDEGNNAVEPCNLNKQTDSNIGNSSCTENNSSSHMSSSSTPKTILPPTIQTHIPDMKRTLSIENQCNIEPLNAKQKTSSDETRFALNSNETDPTTTPKKLLRFFKSRKQIMIAFLNSLNIDSRQDDGSAAEDVDKNMEEFLRVPFRIEELMSFGILICADSFLHILTVTPLKFIWSCLCLLCSIINPGKGIGWCRFHRRHLYQFVRVFVIYAVYKYCLSPISIGKLYHWIRGQAMLKLYVLMAMVEVFDRLMCSFGQDALDSLFWNTTRRPYHPRMILSIIVVLVYAIIHSYILFVHVATLNVAMNSADQTLLTLLISGNFAEIKSTVFKKYNKQHLFKIVTSDICERFKLVLFLGLVLLLNCSQGGMNQEMVNDYVRMSCLILFAEMLCDWIKHSFITKFNFIKSSAYTDYALILAGDITGVGQDDVDHTHAVVKRMGFAQVPLACVMARYVAEAVRYADVLSDEGDSNHVLYSMAVLLTRGSWSQITSMLIGLIILLLILKGALNQIVEKQSHTIILFGPCEHPEASASTNKVHRQQAV